MRSVISIFIIQLIAYQICNAQFEKQFRFTNFGKKDGLIDAFFYQGVQDPNGYLWFGSGTGLYQYDGEKFRKFESPLSHPDFLLENILQCVALDSKGNLWLSSLNSLQWFNTSTRQFSTHSLEDKIFRELCNSIIHSISIDSNGDAWFTTNKNTIFLFQKSDSSFHNLKDKIVLGPGEWIRNCYSFDDKNVFIISSKGIYKYNKLSKLTNFTSFPRGNICYGVNISANKILLSTDKDLLLEFNIETLEFNHLSWLSKSAKSSIPLCVVKNHLGKYYLGGYGLMEIDVNEKSIINKNNSNSNEYDLKVDKIVNMFYDREGNLWLCSHFGLGMLSWQNSQIKSHPLKTNSGQNTEPSMITSLNPNEWFVGTTSTSEILLFNENIGKIKGVRKTHNKDKINYVYFKIDKQVYCSDDFGIYKYDELNKLFHNINLVDQNGITPKEIYKTIKYVNNSVILLSYYNGFYIWDGKQKFMTHFNRWDIDQTNNDTTNNLIIPILTDKNGLIWLATSNGLFTYDLPSKAITRKAKEFNTEVHNFFHNIGAYQSSDGHIWFNSPLKGIFEYYEENGTEYLNNYNQHTKSGIKSNYCVDLIKDPVDDNFWIFNILGLMKFDRHVKKVTSTLNMQRGLSQDVYGYYKEFNNDGKLMLSYWGDIDIIPIKEYLWDSISPRLSFNSIKVHGNELIKQWGNRIHFIEIPYNNNYIELDWTALHFNNNNLIEYFYNQNTQDTTWISLGNKSELPIGGLEEGRHTISIKAINCDGLESKDPLILHINVIAPFWRQSWFLLSSIFSSLIGFYLLYQYRMNQIKREAKMKMEFTEQISNIELRALRAQMNPHFIFNCLNSIQKYILKNDQYHASQYLTKFSRLIRLILDQSNQSYILLQSELELLQLYVDMEKLRFDNSFSFNIEIDKDIDQLSIEIPSMLIQPYLENAIWHGLLHKESNDGKINLNIIKIDQHLRVQIQDNGSGRKKAEELKSKQVLKKKSFGMKITEDRISLFNAIHNQHATHEVIDLYDGETPLGTQVIITIPFRPINENEVK